LHPDEVYNLDLETVQDLFNSIGPIEAEKYLNLLEVSAFPQMKREGQNKTLNRLKRIAYSFNRQSERPAMTTKQFFDQLRASK